ncbi:CD99 antigen [Colius striatus]|uniref:CD99 antigen n=1 Tax=Colius striatus TaxID=57412 RepID=UPI002B1DA534|nr:CD99 antigen [Colius striatus]
MWHCSLLPVAVLVTLLGSVRGDYDDFNLGDALGEATKPPPPRKTPAPDFNDFNLEDAFSPNDPKPGPPANPRDTDNPKQNPSGHPKDSGKIEDSDLLDDSPKGGGGGSGSNERRGSGPSNDEGTEASQGAIAGIVSAVLATVVGAVSSFIAYQKKKLCFKQSDEENVNMESHRGAQSEPPVQRTLLEN